ncbi:MAG: Abi family protein [Steroidobacteraceae bacterium]
MCELLTFGQLSQWYSNLAKGTDRKEIAEPYGVDEQIIVSFAHHLAYVRNVCAHHMRLWNRDMTIGMTIRIIRSGLAKRSTTQKPKRVYNTLVMLVHLLDRISPRSQWRQHLLAPV